MSSNCIVDDKFKIGALGESKCPTGYSPIRSLSTCNEARKEMSISRWNSEDNKGNARLPYCWVGRGGGANYNSNGDSGKDIEGSRLLCESRKSYYPL